MPLSVERVFPTGSRNGAMQCVDVPVADDGILEANETFSVFLSSLEPVEQEQTTVTIRDGKIIAGHVALHFNIDAVSTAD